MKFLTLTTVLFGCELLFTAVKSAALLSPRDAIKRYVAVPCFFLEAGLGLVLSFLFLKFAWRSTEAIQTVGFMIIGIEVMCVLSEAILVLTKVRGTGREPMPRQRGRVSTKWLSVLLGLTTAIIQVEGAARVRTYGALSRVVAICVQVAIVLLALAGCILSRNEYHLRIRMLLATIFFVLATLAAFAFSYLPRPASAQQMTLQQLFTIIDASDQTNPTAVACFQLIVATCFTSFAFWRLPDLSEHPRHIAHVLAAETAIFGVAPAVLVMGLTDASALRVVRQFMFTVYPQSLALIAPLLVSFLSTLGRQISNQRK